MTSRAGVPRAFSARMTSSVTAAPVASSAALTALTSLDSDVAAAAARWPPVPTW